MSHIMTEEEWKDLIKQEPEYQRAEWELLYRALTEYKDVNEGYIFKKRVKVGNDLVDIAYDLSTWTGDPIWVDAAE